MPVSPYMDRNQPHVAQLQDSFINHLVAPLYNSFSNAGLLPGVWVEEETSSADTDTEPDDSNEDPLSASEDERVKTKRKKRRKSKRRKIHCEITTNIQRNYKMWRQKVKESEREMAMNVQEDRSDDDDDDDEDDLLLMPESSRHEDIIEEEENGSECSSNPEFRRGPED